MVDLLRAAKKHLRHVIVRLGGLHVKKRRGKGGAFHRFEGQHPPGIQRFRFRSDVF
jgi:hypothetical protein